MPRRKTNVRRIYDDELLFKTYFGWGAAATYRKLAEFCIRIGMVDPRKGKPSQMGPYWAVWRHALENADDPEVYRLYKEWSYERDHLRRERTQRDFWIHIQRVAYENRSICNRDTYEDFCDRHGLDYDPDKNKMSIEEAVDYDKFLKIAQEIGGEQSH